MAEQRGWSTEAQRYFDGGGPMPVDATEREDAERFAAAVRAYASGLPPLDDRVDERVMAAVRTRARPRRPTGWRALVEPRAFTLRPALAAAAAVTLVVLSSVLTMLVSGGAGTAAPTSASGTILVRFEVRAPQAQRVALAGTFNEWSDSSIVFVRGGEADQWTVTVALAPGRYQYLFVVDGEQWIPDPRAHAQIEDEFGQVNSLLVVGPRGVVRS
jgi:hypothetical protein